MCTLTSTLVNFLGQLAYIDCIYFVYLFDFSSRHILRRDTLISMLSIFRAQTCLHPVNNNFVNYIYTTFSSITVFQLFLEARTHLINVP